jgi:hypothetical protein
MKDGPSASPSVKHNMKFKKKNQQQHHNKEEKGIPAFKLSNLNKLLLER